MDKWIYLAHALCWSVFWLRPLLARGETSAVATPVATVERKAPHARLLVMLHGVAFGIMYFGIGNAAFSGGRVHRLFTPQPLAGGVLIALAAVLVLRALASFESWRLRAEIEVGHRLATGGPFRFVRHPIYLAMIVLGLGTFLWIATAAVGVGVLLVAVMADVRARAEEKLLVESFGDEYRHYMTGVKRFIPLIY